MVSLAAVKAGNAALLSTLPTGFTGVFLGATSGIGLHALKQLAIITAEKAPHIYIIGRSAVNAAPLLDELRQSNVSAKFIFIEKDISLVRSVDDVVAEIRRHEEKVDLLFMSPGFISFHGRKETIEGLEPSMTTRYYSRVQAIQLLLPLLNRSENPHVTNILAGGQEGPLLDDDLDLAQPGNYTFVRGSIHSATMLTLSLEKFASENPSISFVHAYPGLTSTPSLTRGSSGVASILLRWIVSPIAHTFFASSAEDVGARALFYATNSRYTVSQKSNQAAPLPQGLSTAGQTGQGVFLVDHKGDTPQNEDLLRGLREKSTERVWTHTLQIFDRVAKQ